MKKFRYFVMWVDGRLVPQTREFRVFVDAMSCVRELLATGTTARIRREERK
jgi:hypothetical protein